MMKRTAALAASVLAMALALAGCGSSDPVERAQQQLNSRLNAYVQVKQRLETLALRRPQLKAQIDRVLNETDPAFRQARQGGQAQDAGAKQNAASEVGMLAARLDALEKQLDPKPAATSAAPAPSRQTANQSGFGASSQPPVQAPTDQRGGVAAAPGGKLQTGWHTPAPATPGQTSAPSGKLATAAGAAPRPPGGGSGFGGTAGGTSAASAPASGFGKTPSQAPASATAGGFGGSTAGVPPAKAHGAGPGVTAANPAAAPSSRSGFGVAEPSGANSRQTAQTPERIGPALHKSPTPGAGSSAVAKIPSTSPGSGFSSAGTATPRPSNAPGGSGRTAPTAATGSGSTLDFTLERQAAAPGNVMDFTLEPQSKHQDSGADITLDRQAPSRSGASGGKLP